jgi:hypothetical protein
MMPGKDQSWRLRSRIIWGSEGARESVWSCFVDGSGGGMEERRTDVSLVEGMTTEAFHERR